MLSPAILAAVPLLGGVVIGAFGGVHVRIALALLATAWAGAAGGLRVGRRRSFVAACVVGYAAAGITLGASAARGASRSSILEWFTASPGAREPVRLTAVLRQDASVTPFGVVALVDTTSIVTEDRSLPIDGGVRVSVGGALASRAARAWRQGRTITFSALLRDPVSYRNVGVPNDRDRFTREGVALLASVKSAALVTVVTHGAWYDEASASVRAYVRAATTDAVGRWNAKSAGVVTAILIGDRGGLDQDDERRLQEAGTYHVIAISGGNIALLTAMLVVLGRVARLPVRTTYAASIVLLTFYGYTAGLAPSVLRATLASVIYLFARVIDHRGSATNALAVAAATAAASTPLSVLDPGFVLSFGATFAIVGAASRLIAPIRTQRAETRARAVARAVALAAAGLGGATLCAEVALLPVGARLFGRVSFAGLVLNFAAVPLMSLIQVAGLAAVAVHPVSRMASAGCGWLAHAGTIALLGSARLVDVWPWLVIDVPPPPMWVIGVWYASAGVLVAWWRQPRIRRVALAAIAAAGTLIVAGPTQLRRGGAAQPAPGWSRLAFIDVGQGDATVLMPSGGPPMLVDAGGAPGSSFDLGRRVTVPALWALGVSRLGILALTHGDPDHIGGAAAVVRALKPSEIWEGVPVPGHQALAVVHRAAAERGVTWKSVWTGDTQLAGAARIRVLNPPPPDWQRLKVRNDDSVVLEVRIGDVAVILPGDIGQTTERALLTMLGRAPLTVVKAPHHGSAGGSSTEFIDATRPAAVIFSAGRRNPFGHPAPAVVDRYRTAGARVFRTDEDGEVILDTDGHHVVMWTWSGRREELRVSVEGRGGR